MSTVSLTLEEAYRLALDALTSREISAPQGEAIAEIVVRAEADECAAHGLFRIPFYLAALKNAHINPTAEPIVDNAGPGIVQVDAKFGYAPYALKLGIPLLIKAAKRQGVAVLCVNNAYHIAGLWPEIEAITDADLVGFAFTNALPAVAPAGGTRALFGTNPMAFGWPRRNAPPVVFDQASSVVSKGEVQIHKRDGRPIPEGWAVGPDGNATTDPAAAVQGALLPFGGHKGSSIALMVELLAGALVGDLFSFEVQARAPGTEAPCGGELLIAIDPEACAGGQSRAEQDAHAERMFAELLSQDGVRLPSERRYAARERTKRQGIVIPTSLYESLRSNFQVG